MAETIDGAGNTDQEITATELQKIDGKGDHVVRGVGQDLTILDKRDGEGTTTLRGFRNVTIVGKKDGDGGLIVANCASITIALVNGKGQTYLRIDGPKHIGRKDGDGNVYFTGTAPQVDSKDGAGNVIRE